MKFKLENAREFGWDGLKGKAYNTKEQFPPASAAYFEVTGRHGKTKTSSSDRIYYVIQGKGEFVLDGSPFSVEQTDVIIVPKNTPYDYRATEGVLRLFLVHSPAYDLAHDVSLEDKD